MCRAGLEKYDWLAYGMQDGRRVTDTILERVSTGAEMGSEGRLLSERNLP